MVIVVVEDVDVLVVPRRAADVRSAARSVVDMVQRKRELIARAGEDECPVGVAITVGRVSRVAVEDIVGDRGLGDCAVTRRDELTPDVLNNC